ncbi:MAG: DNA replication/repair protein RecF [Candidatus Sericytochromatia bacterium]
MRYNPPAMFLKHIELTDFRNYETLSVDFTAKKVILLGNNAQGKTNLLEAINMLATGKSATAHKDSELVRFGAPQAVIRSEVQRELTDAGIDMLIRTHGRRAVRINGVSQKRLADLFGKVLVVLFRSEDLQLVKGGPAERRSYLDQMLVQLSGSHYQHLHDFDRVATQRNHLLRAIGEGQATVDQLESWNEQLIHFAMAIWRRRIQLIEALAPRVAHWHEQISEGKEKLSLRYVPSIELGPDPDQWEANIRKALEELQRREIGRGQTMVGPHRDDMELLINDHPARSFGSQGQQRTVVLALKLAELDYVREMADESPLLLLDDVLAELDVRRQNALLASIGDNVQTFVTSTHLNDFSAAWLEQADIYRVETGELKLMKSMKDTPKG